MRLLYATSIRYPSALANRIQAVSMARAFAAILNNNFWFGGNDIILENSDVQIYNFGVKKSWQLAWKIMSFAREKQITHIYCREARLLFFVAFYNLFIFWRPLKIGYEVHALLGRSRLDYITDAILSLVVDCYFFTTKQLLDLYSHKYRLKKNQSIVLPDAVDLTIFDLSISKEEARNKLGRLVDDKIIGFCGRFKTLNLDKGIGDILASLKLLPAEIKFIAVGGSDEDIAEYKNKTTEFGLGDRTLFLGHVSQAELAVYQKAFDLLLMPFPWQTHFAYYMSPLKMFEYMVSKRPIVATNLPSVIEILNERNAILVPPNNPTNLAAAINELYRNPSLGQKLADQAYHDVQNHTWTKRAERVCYIMSNV